MPTILFVGAAAIFGTISRLKYANRIFDSIRNGRLKDWSVGLNRKKTKLLVGNRNNLIDKSSSTNRHNDYCTHYFYKSATNSIYASADYRFYSGNNYFTGFF